MRYATEVTPRVMWFNFGHVFGVTASAGHRLDGRKRARTTTGFVLCSGVLFRKCYVHTSNPRAHRSNAKQGCHGDGPQDHAGALDHNTLPFRDGGDRSAQISVGRSGSLLLLSGRLSEARAPRIGRRRVVVSPLSNEHSQPCRSCRVSAESGRDQHLTFRFKP